MNCICIRCLSPSSIQLPSPTLSPSVTFARRRILVHHESRCLCLPRDNPSAREWSSSGIHAYTASPNIAGPWGWMHPDSGTDFASLYVPTKAQGRIDGTPFLGITAVATIKTRLALDTPHTMAHE